MIFPIPQSLVEKSGSYIFKGQHTTLTELFRSVKSGSEDVSVFKNAMLEKEEYILDISKNGVEITASCEEGLYRAVTSLYQLLITDGSMLHAVRIEDKPQFERRGFMLDVSRCRMRTVATLKELIDSLSELKYNEFQLYFEGECFKYSAYPDHAADYDCLGPSEIAEIQKYCKERFIDLVPNQNSFGHLGPWLKYEQFKNLEISDGKTKTSTINPLLPESYDFISNLYESVLPHFDSEYVNIGLDEAGGLGKFQTEEYCNQNGKDTLFMEWLNKLAELAKNKYGKKVMFWGDMINHTGGLFDRVPKGAVALEWAYDLIQNQLMTEHCMTYQKTGVEYYVCPSTNTYMSFTGRADVTYYNIRNTAEIGAKYGARGYLLTDWGCGEGHPHFDVWSLIPTALAGQYAWNPGAEQNGEDFKKDYIYATYDYIDRKYFDGKKVSVLLYRLSNYYLLEPERSHLGSLCGMIFRCPIEQKAYHTFFDLNQCGDVFYFDNVIEYISKTLKEVESLKIDDRLKREIIINSQMVILATEYCKLRIGAEPSPEAAAAIIKLGQDIKKEYRKLWLMRNYPHGSETFEGHLDSCTNEFKKYIK